MTTNDKKNIQPNENGYYAEPVRSFLDLVEGNNVTALDILIARFDSKTLLNQVIHRYKVIHDGKHDLELLYPITDCNQFCCNKENVLVFTLENWKLEAPLWRSHIYIDKELNHTCSPKETRNLNTPNSLFQLLHVSLIVPRLHIQQNRRLSTYKD